MTDTLTKLKGLLEKASAETWYVRDFRASEMRRLGWVGKSIDRILITSKDGPQIVESAGENCVVARIQFDNRPDELGENSIADANLIAASHNALPALVKCAEALEQVIVGISQGRAGAANIDRAIKALKSLNEVSA